MQGPDHAWHELFLDGSRMRFARIIEFSGSVCTFQDVQNPPVSQVRTHTISSQTWWVPSWLGVPSLGDANSPGLTTRQSSLTTRWSGETPRPLDGRVRLPDH